MKFGEQIRRLREAKGLSQEKLGELAGLHRTYTSGVERGERNIGLINVLWLANALDVSPGELFEGIQ